MKKAGRGRPQAYRRLQANHTLPESEEEKCSVVDPTNEGFVLQENTWEFHRKF